MDDLQETQKLKKLFDDHKRYFVGSFRFTKDYRSLLADTFHEKKSTSSSKSLKYIAEIVVEITELEKRFQHT